MKKADKEEYETVSTDLVKSRSLFKQNIKDVKVAIRPAVKEFEQRKAAERWQKATTATVSYTHLTLPTNREV